MTSKAREAADKLLDALPGIFVEGTPAHKTAVAAFTTFEAQIREECAMILDDMEVPYRENIDCAEIAAFEHALSAGAAAIRGGGNG